MTRFQLFKEYKELSLVLHYAMITRDPMRYDLFEQEKALGSVLMINNRHIFNKLAKAYCAKYHS